MPIYHDVNTPKPFIDPTIPWDRNLFPEDAEARNGAAKPDHIYMDSMGFGMGCCCLQITFQACNIDEARMLYDQLAPLGPVMVGCEFGLFLVVVVFLSRDGAEEEKDGKQGCSWRRCYTQNGSRYFYQFVICKHQQLKSSRTG
jgi:hypothetical protein